MEGDQEEQEVLHPSKSPWSFLNEHLVLLLFSQMLPLHRQNSVTCKAACHGEGISTRTLHECACLAQRPCAH